MFLYHTVNFEMLSLYYNDKYLTCKNSCNIVFICTAHMASSVFQFIYELLFPRDLSSQMISLSIHTSSTQCSWMEMEKSDSKITFSLEKNNKDDSRYSFQSRWLKSEEIPELCVRLGSPHICTFVVIFLGHRDSSSLSLPQLINTK